MNGFYDSVTRCTSPSGCRIMDADTHLRSQIDQILRNGASSMLSNVGTPVHTPASEPSGSCNRPQQSRSFIPNHPNASAASNTMQAPNTRQYATVGQERSNLINRRFPQQQARGGRSSCGASAGARPAPSGPYSRSNRGSNGFQHPNNVRQRRANLGKKESVVTRDVFMLDAGCTLVPRGSKRAPLYNNNQV
eukprot:Seg1618.2 transcript_id=Seg1618.2/GoldUCD/mRNA.D3Y31 product="hypothetical protein" protein_id=Seg1618.2/GoldUCD/D3Y31